MATTYTPIATNTLSSAASSYTFSSISGSYTDLRLVFNFGITTGNAAAYIRVNSDSGSNYSNTLITGNGTTAASSRNSSQTEIYLLQTIGQGSSAGFFAPMLLDFMNYSNTTTNKSLLARGFGTNNTPTTEVNANNGLWRSTAAITSITIYAQSSTFIAGSSFTLYGIKAA